MAAGRARYLESSHPSSYIHHLSYNHSSSYSNVNTSMIAEELHLKNKGGSMEDITDKGKLLLTTAADKGNTMSHSHELNQKPKQLQSSSKNVFSIGYDKSLYSSLVPPSLIRTCHHCGLFGSLRCSQCKQTRYCSVDCQKKDWPAHSVLCEPLKQNESKDNGGQLPAKTEKGVYLKGNSTSGDEDKKIMLSDLQPLGIQKATEVQGTVTEFKSPSEFSIQMNSPEVADHISKLSVKLQDSYASTVIQEQYIAIKGEVCVARCSLDQTWNRALVKDVDLLQKKARVFYIDYGNEENISLSCIRALHKDTELLVPPCAIKCSFANYDQKKKGWNEGTASFSSQLMRKHCSVIVVDILQEETMPSFAVDIVHPDLGNSLDKVPLETRSDLAPGSNAEGADSAIVSENHSKGGKEKIPEDHSAYSFAECVSVCVGDAFSGMVSCVQSPENFFCQQVDSARQLAELQVSLNEHCAKFPSSPAFHPAAGNVCCAQFTEDDLWYRAAVITYISEDTVLAGYIDYGNFEVLPLTRLRPMIPRLMDLPAQAIRCTLGGVKPPSESWTSEAVSLMKQLVKDKVFTVKVLDKKSCKSVVELIDASVTPVMNISNHLIEKGCAAEESGVAVPAIGMSDIKQVEEDTENKVLYKWNKLSLKQTVDVIVCTLYSPGEFYCQISNDSDLLALNLLNKSVSEYCQKTPPNVLKAKNGEPCCAFFSDDGNWYRALVKNVTPSGTVKVFFVDYGNVQEVPLDKIRQISSSFLKLPFQGIKCWLSGIKPGNSKWIPEATARFRTHVAGITLQARVTSVSKQGAGVELIDNSTGHPKVINEILASEKLAVKEVLQDRNKFPNKSVNKNETSLGRWKSIGFALGETVSVCVTEIVSPDVFYVVPAESKDQGKLDRQLIELQRYCKSYENQPYKPKVGEACCARFSGDGRWYRALVLKASWSVVEVLYADHGSTETLPLSKVLPIADSYLKLPFQTITCSLAGIEKADWSSLLLDRLKEILLNKYVTITVKEINGNVNLVTVEQPCENGTVNVVDKLVTEGLVKSRRAENLSAEHQGNGDETKCCCAELKMQLKKHEQILLFFLNKYGNPDGFTEMKKLLEH